VHCADNRLHRLALQLNTTFDALPGPLGGCHRMLDPLALAGDLLIERVNGFFFGIFRI
jgi:hypothetical protein